MQLQVLQAEVGKFQAQQRVLSVCLAAGNTFGALTLHSRSGPSLCPRLSCSKMSHFSDMYSFTVPIALDLPTRLPQILKRPNPLI